MSDVEAYYIPRYLDDPERWLFWSMDEAIMIIAPLIFGIYMGNLLISLVASFILYTSWRKIKGTEQANLAVYAFYWFFPKALTRLASPPSYIRSYIG
jgi:conjugal transfer pilus assembly protein TraL